MAYEVKPRDREKKDGANPYDSVLSGGDSNPNRVASSMTPAAAPAGPEMMNAGGPTATGHVNFADIYNANAGVAQRESGKRADAADAAGQKAIQGRTGAVQNFSAQRTGATNTGPNAADYSYATGQAKFQKPEPTGAKTGANSGAYFTERQEGLDGGEAPTRGNTLAPTSPNLNVPTEADWRAGLEAGAKKGYSGPGSLAEQNGYDKLLQETVAAQDLAKNPVTGLGQLDSALLNAAGRPRFAGLESKYAGLQGDLTKANDASIAQATAAKAASKGAQGDYERLLSDYDAKKTADAAAAEAGKPKPIVIGAAPGAGGSSPILGMDPETQRAWDALAPEDRAHKLGADRTFDQASSMADKFLVGVLGSYGVSQEEADLIRDNLTEADWAEYQKAVATGADAFLKWIRTMQAKAKVA